MRGLQSDVRARAGHARLTAAGCARPRRVHAPRHSRVCAAAQGTRASRASLQAGVRSLAGHACKASGAPATVAWRAKWLKMNDSEKEAISRLVGLNAAGKNPAVCRQDSMLKEVQSMVINCSYVDACLVTSLTSRWQYVCGEEGCKYVNLKCCEIFVQGLKAERHPGMSKGGKVNSTCCSVHKNTELVPDNAGIRIYVRTTRQVRVDSEILVMYQTDRGFFGGVQGRCRCCLCENRTPECCV
jgi:hypothetical protein